MTLRGIQLQSCKDNLEIYIYLQQRLNQWQDHVHLLQAENTLRFHHDKSTIKLFLYSYTVASVVSIGAEVAVMEIPDLKARVEAPGMNALALRANARKAKAA
jgi:hypothetical protein